MEEVNQKEKEISLKEFGSDASATNTIEDSEKSTSKNTDGLESGIEDSSVEETEVSIPTDKKYDSSTTFITEDFEVLEKIGEGGMGSVYKVKDRKLDKVFAIKVLKKELAADQAAYKRFEQETESTSKLSHPNIISIYSHGRTDSGEPYLVMDYLEGKSLAEYIEEQSLNTDQIIDIFIQVCQGLEHAHENKIVHRDIKPTNIILNQNESGFFDVKILDFGIAKVVDGSVRETHNLTQTGEVYGSPQYMSPEQCLGFMLEEQSDIYSLGCTLYETITGKPPFAGANPIQLVVKHINENVKGFGSEYRSTKQDKQLEKVTLKCLEKEQADRIQSVSILKENLECINDGKSIPGYTIKSKAKLTLTKRQLANIIGFVVLIFTWITLYSNYYITPFKPLWFLLYFSNVLFSYCGASLLFFSIEKFKKIKSSIQNARTWWIAIISFSSSIIFLGSIIKSVSDLLKNSFDYQLCGTFESIGSMITILFALSLTAAGICFALFKNKKATTRYILTKFLVTASLLIAAPFVIAPNWAPNITKALADESRAIPDLREFLLKQTCKLSKYFDISGNYDTLATYQHFRGKYKESYSTFAEGIALVKGIPSSEKNVKNANYELARLYSFRAEQLNKDGRYSEAVKDLEVSIDLSKDMDIHRYPWFDQRFNLCLFQFNAGNLDGAEASLQKYEIEEPTRIKNIAILKAKILAAKNKNKEALDTLNKVWSSRGENDILMLFLKGIILEKLGEQEKANTLFKKIVNSGRFGYLIQNVSSNELKAFLHNRLGNSKKAIKMIESKNLDMNDLIKSLKAEGFDKIGVSIKWEPLVTK